MRSSLGPMAGVVAVAAAVSALGAVPAGAEPIIDAAVAGAPDPGDLVPITIDGTDGYDGAHMIVITSCANATTYEPHGTECHDEAPVLVADGDTFSGVGILPAPVDGTDYTLQYEWTEPFRYSQICAATAPQPCLIRAAGLRLDGEVRWTQDLAVSTPLPLPRLRIGPPQAAPEGDVGTSEVFFAIELSREVEWWVQTYVSLASAEANLDLDYPAAPGPVDARLAQPQWINVAPSGYPAVGPAGATVEIYGDVYDEDDERVLLQLRYPQNAAIGGFFGLSQLTIVDDDTTRLIPGHAAVVEGDNGTTIVEVPYTLSALSFEAVTFDWTVGPAGGSTPGVDFVVSSGSAVIAAGEDHTVIEVEIIGDEIREPDETVIVAPFNIQNAKAGGYLGLAGVTIINDDPLPDCLDRLLPGADLLGCDLSGQAFVGLDLTGADLRHADLTGTWFVNSTLSLVDLAGADLTDAAFVGTDLTEASIGGVGAPFIVGSTLDAAELSGVLAGALISGGTAFNATFTGDFTNAALSSIDLTGAGLDLGTFAATTWSSVTCPDGSDSTDTGDTCLIVRIAVTDWQSGTNAIWIESPREGVDVDIFGAPNLAPALHREFRFGPTGDEAALEPVRTHDLDGDGWLDTHWHVDRDAAGFRVFDNRACISGTVRNGSRVWGCTSVFVRHYDTRPTSPPLSPPVSPGGLFGGLVPVLQGPVGLMATAAGLGLIFLLGSTRAERTLQPVRREDGVDDDDHHTTG